MSDVLYYIILLLYLALVYGVVRLGIKLKSEGFFENKLFRWGYASILYIAMLIPILAGVLGVGDTWLIVWVIGLISIGWIAFEILDADEWLDTCAAISGIGGGIASAILSGGYDGSVMGMILGVVILSVVYGIAGWIAGWIVGLVGGVVGEILWGRAWDVKKIAESKYNEALNHLANGKIGECLKYANQALNLLKNYNYNEKDENSKPYLDTKLANKIISLKDSLELLQKMEGYYYSKKYNELLKTYEEIMSKNLDSDLNEILKEKYDEIKEEYENQFNNELETGDNLFRRKKLNQAMDYYRKMLNDYPMFKDILDSKIETCENEILNNKFIKELQKADELFKNNEIEEAMDEYEKLLNSLSGKYQKISYKYEKVLNDKLQKCKEILKNPPLELFIERAKKYESEGYSEYHKNNISKAIELWKMAVEQYKGGLNVARLKGFDDIVLRIKSKISTLLDNIIYAEIELIKKELGW